MGPWVKGNPKRLLIIRKSYTLLSMKFREQRVNEKDDDRAL